MTDETRERMRAAQLGKHHTEATRAKIGDAHRGRKLAPATVAKRVGRKHSDETRARMSKARDGKMMSDATRAKLKAARAHQVTARADTKPERAVQAWLEARGIPFETHRHIPGLNHQWDVKLLGRAVLIEVDGCYWHGCEKCGYPGVNGKPERDAELDVEAAALGWRVIRIWEHEANAGDFSVLGAL